MSSPNHSFQVQVLIKLFRLVFSNLPYIPLIPFTKSLHSSSYPSLWLQWIVCFQGLLVRVDFLNVFQSVRFSKKRFEHKLCSTGIVEQVKELYSIEILFWKQRCYWIKRYLFLFNHTFFFSRELLFDNLKS